VSSGDADLDPFVESVVDLADEVFTQVCAWMRHAYKSEWPVDIIADGVERALDAVGDLLGEEAERDSVIKRLGRKGDANALRQALRRVIVLRLNTEEDERGA
jgi:hypothetical protein